MTNLSVVVITRNRLVKLKRCLESIQRVISGAELIVVDNGSNDGTGEYLQNNPNIKHVMLPVNIGMAAGRNVGIQKAKNDYIMVLDDDAWIVELDFQAIEKYFVGHEDVGIIAPRLFYPDGTLQESARSFPTLPALFWRGTGLYRLFPNVIWYKKYVNHNNDKLHEIDWAMGACLIIPRLIFDRVGFFDEKYFGYYDDVDYCYRVRCFGHITMYWPEAKIFHEYTRTSSRGLNIALFRHLRSMARFLWG